MATSVGEAEMWLFVALGALLTLAGLAFMRPATAARGLEHM
jgi:hypothetical protein